MINSKDSNNIGQSQQRGLWDDIVADPGPAVPLVCPQLIYKRQDSNKKRILGPILARISHEPDKFFMRNAG